MGTRKEKPRAFYDIINGKKVYYIGKQVPNKDGNIITVRLTGSEYRTAEAAEKAWKKSAGKNNNE